MLNILDIRYRIAVLDFCLGKTTLLYLDVRHVIPPDDSANFGVNNRAISNKNSPLLHPVGWYDGWRGDGSGWLGGWWAAFHPISQWMQKMCRNYRKKENSLHFCSDQSAIPSGDQTQTCATSQWEIHLYSETCH